MPQVFLKKQKKKIEKKLKKNFLNEKVKKTRTKSGNGTALIEPALAGESLYFALIMHSLYACPETTKEPSLKVNGVSMRKN